MDTINSTSSMDRGRAIYDNCRETMNIYIIYSKIISSIVKFIQFIICFLFHPIAYVYNGRPWESLIQISGVDKFIYLFI